MPESSIIASRSLTGAGRRPAVRPHGVRRIVAAVFAVAMIAVYLSVAGPTMLSAVDHLTSASPVWLVTALIATTASMVAFAALRGQTLSVAGAQVSLRRTVAVSYGAGAVHTTMPAGAVFSTTYAFKHLKAWGVSTSAFTWSMTITGLLSSATLAAVGLLGLALGTGTGGSPLWSVAEISLAATVVGAMVHVGRHPAVVVRLAHRILLRINRLGHRPAESGFARLTEVLDDLRSIRPAGRDWIVSAALALANWVLDLACLAACCAAVGVHVGLPALLITYTAGMAAGSLLPVPAGLGAVETAMTLGLTVAGAAAPPALAAVLLYRLLSTGSVLVVGWLVVALQRVRPVVADDSRPTCHPESVPRPR